MPLAALLVLLSFVPSGAPPNQRSDALAQPGQEAQPQPPSPASQSPSATQAPSQSHSAKSSAASKAPATAKSRNHKKKSAAPCVASTTVHTPASSKTQNASPDSAGQSSAGSSGTAAPTKDCPPPRIVVRQGGTSEPAIQLAGGPTADQAAQERAGISQLLAQTDQNLKKTAGMQLTAAQQDTVTQAREFMEQSKSAMTNGDLERAHTLVWKAKLLSEDLVKPEK